MNQAYRSAAVRGSARARAANRCLASAHEAISAATKTVVNARLVMTSSISGFGLLANVRIVGSPDTDWLEDISSHHALRQTPRRVGALERQAAVTELDMGDPYFRRHAAEQDYPWHQSN